MKTLEQIVTILPLHHSALARGYVSTKTDGIVEPYDGKFGKGYIVKRHCAFSTLYYHRDYYIVEPRS